MRVLPTALKHGITEQHIRSALEVPMRRVELDIDLLLVIAADPTTRLLEIVVAEIDGLDPRVIHAMPLRAKFHQFL